MDSIVAGVDLMSDSLTVCQTETCSNSATETAIENHLQQVTDHKTVIKLYV